MLVVGNDIMQLGAERTPRQLKEPPEKLNHLGGTLEEVSRLLDEARRQNPGNPALIALAARA